MKDDKIMAKVLSAVLIPQVDDALREKFGMDKDQTSCALFTATYDDFIYLALDDATKKADVTASYVHAFYGGGANASSKLQGECMGVLAGKTVAAVQAGIRAVLEMEASQTVYQVSCNDDDSITRLVYPVARTGTLFEKYFGIPQDSSMAYLVGPPMESYYAADAALKASGATLAMFFEPAETNSGGCLMTGSFSQCQAAANAFMDAIQWVADNPIYRD